MLLKQKQNIAIFKIKKCLYFTETWNIKNSYLSYETLVWIVKYHSLVSLDYNLQGIEWNELYCKYSHISCFEM